MAIVSLIALLAALALAALIALHPWSSTTSVAPQLSLRQGLGAEVDDAVALPPSRKLAVAPARPAGPGTQTLAASEATAGSGGSAGALDIAPARVVSRATPARPPAVPPTPTAPESEPAPPPPTSPPPAPVQVAAPAPQSEPAAGMPVKHPVSSGAHPSGPSAAGLGPVYDVAGEPIEVGDGDELAFSFFFYIEPIAYRPPGEENLILQLRGEPGAPPRFGLQLWDDGDDQRGLWSSGEAMGGERFLAPLGEGEWHQAVVYFHASSGDDGFYLLLLDGEPIDARAWISLIDSEGGSAQLEAGLFRAGEPIVDARDVFFGPTYVEAR